ncbi:DUF5956 family protein [Arthrobacter sp. NPDC057388]|uniref:DUF5956 family protein n=1 Tax=Arthrobacter sp. NPDC057388 TaxID=3346116 RepID=UPI0036293854
MWSNVQMAAPSASWVELAENDWGALIGWAAGEENLRRHPASDAGRTVTGYVEQAGEREPFEEPFRPLGVGFWKPRRRPERSLPGSGFLGGKVCRWLSAGVGQFTERGRYDPHSVGVRRPRPPTPGAGK